MKCKLQMIKEMEKDIEIRMELAKIVIGSMNNGVEGWLSEYLVKKGWTKLEEDSVVLTKEEYEKLRALKDDYVKGYEAGVDEGWDNAVTETAKKFASGFINDILPKIMNGHSEKELQIAMAMTNYYNELNEMLNLKKKGGDENAERYDCEL